MSATDDNDLSEVPWVPVAPTFSSFLFDMMSQWRFRALQYELALRAVASRPTEQDRRRLRSLLRPGPCDERDGVFIDRYFTPHGLLRVSNDEPLEEGQAVWHVQADSVDALDTFLAVLAPIGTLTRHFELGVWPESLRAEAQARLDRFRRDNPPLAGAMQAGYQPLIQAASAAEVRRIPPAATASPPPGSLSAISPAVSVSAAPQRRLRYDSRRPCSQIADIFN